VLHAERLGLERERGHVIGRGLGVEIERARILAQVLEAALELRDQLPARSREAFGHGDLGQLGAHPQAPGHRAGERRAPELVPADQRVAAGAYQVILARRPGEPARHGERAPELLRRRGLGELVVAKFAVLGVLGAEHVEPGAEHAIAGADVIGLAVDRDRAQVIVRRADDVRDVIGERRGQPAAPGAAAARHQLDGQLEAAAEGVEHAAIALAGEIERDDHERRGIGGAQRRGRAEHENDHRVARQAVEHEPDVERAGQLARQLIAGHRDQPDAAAVEVEARREVRAARVGELARQLADLGGQLILRRRRDLGLGRELDVGLDLAGRVARVEVLDDLARHRPGDRVGVARRGEPIGVEARAVRRALGAPRPRGLAQPVDLGARGGQLGRGVAAARVVLEVVT
jgi:hypothetical protein